MTLSGCPTVDVGNGPIAPGTCNPDPQKFQDEIWPMAINPPDTAKSCIANAGCHSQGTGRSALRLVPMPATQLEWSQNYDVVTRFLNCSTPEASPFITKPSAGGDPHGGGDLWTLGVDPELKVEKWIGGM